MLPNGTVLEETSRTTSILDPATWTWTPLPKPITRHKSGEGAVLLPGSPSGSTVAALIGGGDASTATAGFESLDAAASPVGWTRLAPLPQVREHMSPVLLPDGSLLGVGGNSQGLFLQPQFSALRYVPGASSWTTLASQVERRGYHSSAVLLPDGRVFSAGDTGSGGGGNADEIYSPPYLFQGPRPTIIAAPSQAAHGSGFTIETPDVNSRAVLMSPGAATHTVDFSERHIELAVTDRSTTGLTVAVPSDTVALTGYYLLFLVDSTGVPSVATWIHIG
ncbi:galactose oxidase-like domain-containing protein [Dermatophilaceae bacterium Soc4.6]